MTISLPHSRAATRGALAFLACLAFAFAQAAPARAQAQQSGAPPRVPAAGAPAAEGALRLSRAQAAWRMDRPLDVVRELEVMDFATPPAFAGADRAAFLLAQAHLRLGDRAAYERLAAEVAAWERQTDWTRALVGERALLAGTPGAAAAVREAGAKRLAADAEGAERFRAAATRLAAGEDPLGELGHVPGGSAWRPAADDVAARVAYERGDSASAVRALRQVIEGDTAYAARREIEALLADDALRHAEPAAALASWEALDQRWTADRDALRTLAARPGLDSLVTAWEDDPARSGAAPLPVSRAAAGAAELGRSRADAREHAGDWARVFDRPESAHAPGLLLAPAAMDWRAISAADSVARVAAARAARAADDARLERERLAALSRYLGAGRDSLARERAAIETRLARLRALHAGLDSLDQRLRAVRLAALSRYLGAGRDSLARERAAIETRLARLRALHAGLDSLDQRLRAVRNSATARTLERALALLRQCEADERWAAGMDHFWVQGPCFTRAPAGSIGADSALAAERALLRAVRAIVARITAEEPGRIAMSYQLAWRPGVLDRIAREDDDAAGSLAWASRLSTTIDSSLADAARATRARALELRATLLAARADSLARAATRQRDAVARRAVQRSLAAMEGERETIDYGLAASAWAVAVSLEPSAAAVGDTSAAPESPEAVRARAAAIARLRGYLGRHPAGAGRGDARYRLADLLEQEARGAFRVRMADYVRHPDGPVPVLETSESVALHRAILADDPNFPHTDAVLFDLGSLLSERGDPEAMRPFRELVNTAPKSPFAQESWLRLADDAFDHQQFANAVPLYECAVNGPDTTLRVIALYKLGWTDYHVDRFEPAADAFGQVLDLYGAGHVDSRIRLDDDAEVLLVHTLARAGGAPAFAEYFDRRGSRPYELKLLGALGQHLRKYSLYGQAIAADQLLMDRFPVAPEALEAARRMDDTYVRWNRPEERRAALLADADRFAPGSAWVRAQSGDSLRDAGDAFARAALLEVAAQYHRAGRAGGGDEAWREAAKLEERALATWPADPAHRSLHLQASEARAALGDVAGALAHADSVFTGRDSLAAVAALQRVAILDAAYERSRPATSASATGSDSLANAVLAAGDALIGAFPSDPNAPGVRWREAQLAFAHGWFARAADAFGAYAESWPADARAARAATLRADALIRTGDFEKAGDAYERALALARRAGDDSLARRVALAIPACAYRGAEAHVAADSTDDRGNAARFENVALRWPDFEHADVAWYRAGLAYFRAGRTADGARAMGSLVGRQPKSTLARDAVRATAAAWEAEGDTASAAQAWLEYAGRFHGDAQADDASLRAAEFFERSHDVAHSDSLRLAWIRRHPADAATAMALLEPVVTRSLDSVSVSRPVSRWLAVSKPMPGAKRGTPKTPVGDYLARATAHPELASRSIVAHIRFLEGEEAAAACAKIALRQPLARSIGARKAKLDLLLARYKACVDLGDAEWAHAATFRIGEALVLFGDAIEKSERPAGLSPEDRVAYDEIVHRQSDGFFERAEGVWARLLDGQSADRDDVWLARARTELEPRMAIRAQSAPPAAEAPGENSERKQNP